MCPSHPGTHEYHIYHINVHTRHWHRGGQAGYLHGVWASRSPMTALVVVHTHIISWVLDIPSPLSPSSIWVRVSVLYVRRCYRFSGLHAFHSSGDVADGKRRRRIAVFMAYNATASSALALVQCSGHWARHIRSKSTYCGSNLYLPKTRHKCLTTRLNG